MKSFKNKYVKAKWMRQKHLEFLEKRKIRDEREKYIKRILEMVKREVDGIVYFNRQKRRPPGLIGPRRRVRSLNARGWRMKF